MVTACTMQWTEASVSARLGQPLLCAHRYKVKHLLTKAAWVVSSFYGQPFLRAHRRIASWPPLAASVQVSATRHNRAGEPIAAHLVAPSSCIGAHTPVPVPAMLPHPLQCCHLATTSGMGTCLLLHVVRHALLTRPREERMTAAHQMLFTFVSQGQGHPWLRAHSSTAMCSPQAAAEQLQRSQGAPFRLSHCRTASHPFPAADSHRPLSS